MPKIQLFPRLNYQAYTDRSHRCGTLLYLLYVNYIKKLLPRQHLSEIFKHPFPFLCLKENLRHDLSHFLQPLIPSPALSALDPALSSHFP